MTEEEMQDYVVSVPATGTVYRPMSGAVAQRTWLVIEGGNSVGTISENWHHMHPDGSKKAGAVANISYTWTPDVSAVD